MFSSDLLGVRVQCDKDSSDYCRDKVGTVAAVYVTSTSLHLVVMLDQTRELVDFPASNFVVL